VSKVSSQSIEEDRICKKVDYNHAHKYSMRVEVDDSDLRAILENHVVKYCVKKFYSAGLSMFAQHDETTVQIICLTSNSKRPMTHF
jgi:hypothetical protein